MDKQEPTRESEERENAAPTQDERHFDPWEQAFKRDFQRQEREFEF